jgi:hypothetical protein
VPRLTLWRSTVVDAPWQNHDLYYRVTDEIERRANAKLDAALASRKMLPDQVQ